MNKLLALGCIAAVFAVISCGKEALTADSATRTGKLKLVPVTIHASVPETKVTLPAGGALPAWNAGDRIGVFTTDKVLCPAFTALDGGSTSTSFSGQKPEGSRLATAFFPYDASAVLGTSGLSLTLPESQSGRISDAVMVATGNENDGFTFRNVCALLRLNVPASFGIRKVEVVREDRVTGPFTVGADFSISSSEPTSYLEKRAEAASASALSGEIVLSVLPSSSKLLQMALTRTDGKVAFVHTTFTSGKAFEAGRIKNLGTVGSSMTYYDAALLGDAADKQL